MIREPGKHKQGHRVAKHESGRYASGLGGRHIPYAEKDRQTGGVYHEVCIKGDASNKDQY